MAQRPLAPNAPGVERLLALSDGVVAIALTLLVLSLHVPNLPHSHNNAISVDWLAHQLRVLADPLVSYVVAFYVICQFWLAHHRAFRLMAGHDEGLAWWNFFFLFTLTLLPFTSNLLGQYGSNPLAVDIFSVNLILASVSTSTVVTVAQRAGAVGALGRAGGDPVRPVAHPRGGHRGGHLHCRCHLQHRCGQVCLAAHRRRPPVADPMVRQVSADRTGNAGARAGESG